MFHWLVQIPGPTFLWMYGVGSILAIIIGRWLQTRDGTQEYTRTVSLSPVEVAVLQNGTEGLLQTALFRLWQDNFVIIERSGSSSQIYLAANAQRPRGAIEKVVYDHLQKKNAVAVSNFMRDSGLREKADTISRPLYKLLEDQHLLLNDVQIARRNTIGVNLFLVIMVLGGLKLAFGMWYLHPVGYLAGLLFVLFCVCALTFFPKSRASQRGKRYLRDLQKDLQKETTLHKRDSEEEPSSDPVLRVAALGLAGLAGWAVFNEFSQAFHTPSSSSSHLDHSSHSNSDSSDSGGSDSGGGGGCGGCGGGGGD